MNTDFIVICYTYTHSSIIDVNQDGEDWCKRDATNKPKVHVYMYMYIVHVHAYCLYAYILYVQCTVHTHVCVHVHVYLYVQISKYLLFVLD